MTLNVVSVSAQSASQGAAKEEAADERRPAPTHHREKQGRRGETSLERSDGKMAASP